MSAALSVADVLERAADLIEPVGRWTQHVYARNEFGDEAEYIDEAKCFCVLGALSVAAGFGPCDELEPYQANVALRTVAGFDGPLNVWNDAPGRTQAEVVAKLREAAALAREQGK